MAKCYKQEIKRVEILVAPIELVQKILAILKEDMLKEKGVVDFPDTPPPGDLLTTTQ